MMFDRKIRYLGEKNGYETLLSSCDAELRDADITIANLEGPITSNPSKTLLPNGKFGDSLTFTFDPKVAKALKQNGITAVSLANNHSYNFGVAGLKETKKWLKDAGVGYFGSPWNATSTELIIKENGINIAFVGYHAFEPGLSRILSDIKRLSSAGNFVIVMPHWGEEYVSTSTAKLHDLAAQFVAAGAKAVIGSHPHVVMNHEMIGNVPVYYSLGNLLFDQYFSDKVKSGEIVSLDLVFGPDGATISSSSAKTITCAVSSAGRASP